MKSIPNNSHSFLCILSPFKTPHRQNFSSTTVHSSGHSGNLCNGHQLPSSSIQHRWHLSKAWELWNQAANACFSKETNASHPLGWLLSTTRKSKCWQGCGETVSLVHCWWECTMVHLLWKTIWQFLKKLKIATTSSWVIGTHQDHWAVGTRCQTWSSWWAFLCSGPQTTDQGPGTGDPGPSNIFLKNPWVRYNCRGGDRFLPPHAGPVLGTRIRFQGSPQAGLSWHEHVEKFSPSSLVNYHNLCACMKKVSFFFF